MNRKLLVATGLVFLFVIVALVWYFFYAKPVIAPSLSSTNDPLPGNQLLPRFQFIGNADDDEGDSVTEVIQKAEDPLIRVWDKPATGQHFLVEQILLEETSTTTQGTTTIEVKRIVRATTTILLFVDRETGYIYGYSPSDNSVFQITNTIISGVHDAYIFNEGKRIIMRYTENENSGVVGIIATIPSFSPGGTPSPLEGVKYLNSEVSSVAVSEDGGAASYSVKTEGGSAIYSVSSGEPTFVASSPFSEWDLSYGGNILYATTRPSAFAMGVTVVLPSFTTIIGERAALMIKPSSSMFLGSVWSQGGIISFLSDKTTVHTLSLKTLASKCGWGSNNFLLCATPKVVPPGSSYLPDVWFQGLVRFEDTLTEINTSSLTESSFFSFKEEYGLFDITHITISNENNFVSFINKRNGELWIIKRSLLASNEQL